MGITSLTLALLFVHQLDPTASPAPLTMRVCNWLYAYRAWLGSAVFPSPDGGADLLRLVMVFLGKVCGRRLSWPCAETPP